MVVDPYTSASIHASSIPEFSMDLPSALRAAIPVCKLPSLGRTVFFRSSLGSSNYTAFSYKAMSKLITVGCSLPMTIFLRSRNSEAVFLNIYGLENTVQKYQDEYAVNSSTHREVFISSECRYVRR